MHINNAKYIILSGAGKKIHKKDKKFKEKFEGDFLMHNLPPLFFVVEESLQAE